FQAKNAEVDQEAQAARKLINAIIADTSTESDNIGLGKLETRIASANDDVRRFLNEANLELLALLETPNSPDVRRMLARIDTLRDESNQRLEGIRNDMTLQVRSDAAVAIRDQQRTIIVSGIVTALAAVLGLIFALMVSGEITKPVHRLLEGTRAVEAGH